VSRASSPFNASAGTRGSCCRTVRLGNSRATVLSDKSCPASRGGGACLNHLHLMRLVGESSGARVRARACGAGHMAVPDPRQSAAPRGSRGPGDTWRSRTQLEGFRTPVAGSEHSPQVHVAASDLPASGEEGPGPLAGSSVQDPWESGSHMRGPKTSPQGSRPVSRGLGLWLPSRALRSRGHVEAPDLPVREEEVRGPWPPIIRPGPYAQLPSGLVRGYG